MLPREDKRRLVKFIGGWFVTLLLVVGLIFPAATLATINWKNNPELRWISEIRKRKLHAAKAMPHQPRLLVAGGSSGTFSVDAELLEARLGMQAVNLSTHAGLGLRYLLEDARSVARKGDVVVLYLEDYHYAADARNITDMERKFMWTYTPGRLWKLPAGDLLRQIYQNPTSDYKESWKRLNENMQGYPFISQGPRGDFRGIVKPALPTPYQFGHIVQVDKNAAENLRAFFAWCRKNGVGVIGVRPAAFGRMPEDPALAYRGVRSIHKEAGIPLIDNAIPPQLPVELFYDTIYHANAAGRRIITEALAKSLRPLVGGNQAAKPPSPCILLLASRGSGSGRDLVMTGESVDDCRFFSPTDLKHPWCVSPQQFASLQAEGKRLLFADPEVGEILSAAGIASKTVRTQVASIKDWITEYPQHLFAITTAGSFDTGALGVDLPEPFQSLFRQPAPFKAAIIGTGKLGEIHFSQTGAEAASLSQSRRARWQRGLVFPMQFELSSGVEARLDIQFQTVFADSRPGVHIGVFDPGSGTVVRQGHFTGPTRVEWELREILPIAP